MKKLFSKIDNTSKEPNSYLGKVFVVGRHAVTVEEVLAEGIYRALCPSLISASSPPAFRRRNIWILKKTCH